MSIFLDTICFPCYIRVCYEKVKGEISFFRGFVNKLKVLSLFFMFIDNLLLSLGDNEPTDNGNRSYLSVLRSKTEKSDTVIDGGRGVRKPGENGPPSSSEPGFAEHKQPSVPHYAVLFKKQYS